MKKLEEQEGGIFDATEIGASPVYIPMLIILPSNRNITENQELAEKQISELQRNWPQLREANAYVLGRAHDIEPSPRITIPIQFYRV